MQELSAKAYWISLTEGFTTQTKLWLENFEAKNKKQSTSVLLEKINIPLDTAFISSLSTYATDKKIPITALFFSAWGLFINRFSGSDDILFSTEFAEKRIPVRSHTETKETLENYIIKIAAQLENSEKEINAFFQQEINCDFNRYFITTEINEENFIKKLNNAPEETVLGLFIKINHNNLSDIELNLYSRSDLFSSESQKIICQHFILILEKIIHASDYSATHFPILTKDEREKLMQFSMPYKQSFDEPILFAHQLFVKQTEKNPMHLAICSDENTLTYAELNKLSNKIAHFLLDKKVKPNDKVAVMMERTPLLIATMLAIFKTHAVFIPINPKYPDERIQFILEDCQTHLILSDHTRKTPEDYIYKTVFISENLEEIHKYPEHAIILKETNHDELLAYIVYTSGTTGQPKGVCISHLNVVNHLNWYKNYFLINENDRASQFASQGFDAFFCEIIPFLATGGSIFIVNDTTKLTPSLFLPWLVKNKITICDLPTAYAQLLINLELPDNLSLRMMKVGGEALSSYPNKKIPFDIWNGYGPAEATIETTFFKMVSANISPEEQPAKHMPPPIGKPLANARCYVVDKHLELVPFGCVGELLIGGASLSPGYLNRPQLNREKFIPDRFSTSTTSSENTNIQNSIQKEEKLYRTGDLVRWLSDGNLEFLGRTDHQIKIRGYRIELGEVEAALNQYPDVSEVVVLAKETASGQKSLIAWLVPKLERIRIPLQERCLISIDNQEYLQLFTEDISREGLAITGVPDDFKIGASIKINLKLPGTNESQWLSGKIIWQQDKRAGILFDPTEKQKKLLEKSIEYYLATHNLMETLQNAAAKRNLRNAMKKKLPDYMVPSVFSILPRLPITFNGKIDWKALPPPQDFERMLEHKHVPPSTETEKLIKQIWSEVLEQPEISMSDNFFDLGGNSLKVAELSVKLLHKFSISIPAKILIDLPFIPVIAEYIDSNGANFKDTTPIQDDIQRDAILEEDILPHKTEANHTKEKAIQPSGILLTGAAGFLGIFILRELLASTDVKIYCLIRKGEFGSIASRLNAQIEQYRLSDEVNLANRRIVLVGGDIGLHQFGLPTEQYQNLIRHVARVYHCGAQVNTMASYSTVRTSNVQGTREIIRFAVEEFNRPIYYISTLSAAAAIDAEGAFAESWPPATPEGLTGGYGLSKWVSERLLFQAMQRGLPVQIYRSGYILGESHSGIMNLNDSLLLLIKGCIQIGYAPDWHEIIALLPVDFVSRAIVTLSLLYPEKNYVCHLDHPTGILWLDLIHWFNQHNYAIKICSHRLWLKKLLRIGPDNALYPMLPAYLAMKDPPMTPRTALQLTAEKIQAAGMVWPDINDALLQTYLKFLEQAGFFPPLSLRKKEAAD